MIRRLVRFGFTPVGVLVLGFACVAGVSGAVAASYNSYHGSVVEPGSITCTGVSGSVKYKPHLTDKAKGWAVSVVKGSLSGCTTPGGTKVSGVFSSADVAAVHPDIASDPTFILSPLPPDTIVIQPLPNPDPCPSFPCPPGIEFLPKGTPGASPTANCEADNADAIYLEMKIGWNAGKAKIAPSTVIFGGALPAWSSSGTYQFTLPIEGAQVEGSYAGSDGGASSVMGLQTSVTQNELNTTCSSKKGFSGFSFTGTLTLQ
jgi:hypothetical protein